MADSDTHDNQTPTERELPEAFTMNVGEETSRLTQPAAANSGDVDKVREGLEESFPASDPSAETQQSILPKTPVDPQD